MKKLNGVTSYCPTSMTLPMDELIRIFASATEVEQDESCARIVGLNMEGPFLDPAKKGAHVEEYIRKPDIEFFPGMSERFRWKDKGCDCGSEYGRRRGVY